MAQVNTLHSQFASQRAGLATKQETVKILEDLGDEYVILASGDLEKFKLIQSLCQEFFNKIGETRDQMQKADARMTAIIEAEKETFKQTLIRPRDAKYLRKFRKQLNKQPEAM